MKKLELIIFDMDGLMFDTEKIAFISWKKAANSFGYEIDDEIFKKTIGANLERTMEIYLAHFGEKFPIEAIKDERFKISENLIKLNGVSVKEGLYELLDYLKETNIKMAVATSTNRLRATNLLKMAGVDKYFDYVLCGDEIENSKPHPEMFLKVSERLDCLPERCIVLEDSEVGIIAAHRAGMLPIMVPDMKEPDEEVKKLTYRKFSSLHDVKFFLEDMYGQSTGRFEEIAESIAYCGLVCKFCHLADKCSGCKSKNNCCGRHLSESGCYQYNCCVNKGINGCWECNEFPCNEDMFSDSHDIRLLAFVRCAKEEGMERLAEYVLMNQRKGILYGHQKDYDGLGSEDAVLRLLRTGKV